MRELQFRFGVLLKTADFPYEDLLKLMDELRPYLHAQGICLYVRGSLSYKDLDQQVRFEQYEDLKGKKLDVASAAKMLNEKGGYCLWEHYRQGVNLIRVGPRAIADFRGCEECQYFQEAQDMMPCFLLESEIDACGVRARALREQYANQVATTSVPLLPSNMTDVVEENDHATLAKPSPSPKQGGRKRKNMEPTSPAAKRKMPILLTEGMSIEEAEQKGTPCTARRSTPWHSVLCFKPRKEHGSLIIWDPSFETYKYPILVTDQQPVQVPCHTPFAARAQCASYKDLRDVPGRASLHYEFKNYGQYGANTCLLDCMNMLIWLARPDFKSNDFPKMCEKTKIPWKGGSFRGLVPT